MGRPPKSQSVILGMQNMIVVYKDDRALESCRNSIACLLVQSYESFVTSGRNSQLGW